MLFALGGLATFMIGGVTGIFLGSATIDIYLHGTYFVVAHFHYTLFPGDFLRRVCRSVLSGIPKMFGRMMNEILGKIHFLFTFIFFNAIFIPLFVTGLRGNPRRLYEMSNYDFLKPMQSLHVIATIATIGLLLGQLPFVANFVLSMFFGKKAQDNPWHANTLEWATNSPPPFGNFAEPPTVYRDPYEYSVPGASQDWIAQTAPEPFITTVAAD